MWCTRERKEESLKQDKFGVEVSQAQLVKKRGSTDDWSVASNFEKKKANMKDGCEEGRKEVNSGQVVKRAPMNDGSGVRKRKTLMRVYQVWTDGLSEFFWSTSVCCVAAVHASFAY